MKIISIVAAALSLITLGVGVASGDAESAILASRQTVPSLDKNVKVTVKAKEYYVDAGLAERYNVTRDGFFISLGCNALFIIWARRRDKKGGKSMIKGPA